MASIIPVAVQNENAHMLRGKGIEGVKPVPGFMQDENLHIYKGKGAEGFKVGKSNPVRRRERKALGDLSHTGKPLSTAAANRSTSLKDKPNSIKGIQMKEKSAIKEKCTAKEASKSNILTDEEVAKCREWANEGIEHMHFTGNDMQKLEARQHEERVKREVDKAMSALCSMNNALFGHNIPQDIPSDDEVSLKLEFEPEILSPRSIKLPTEPDYGDIDDLFNDDDDDDFNFDGLYLNQRYDLKLKDEFV